MKKDPNVKIGPAYDTEVELKLDPEAIEQRKQELVEIDNRLIAREAKAKEERKQIKGELTDIKDERNSCLAAINSGIRTQTLKVKPYMYLQTGSVQIKRVDTGEVVDERPMTEVERQTELFHLSGEDEADGSKASVGDLAAHRAKKTGKGRGKGKSTEQPEA